MLAYMGSDGGINAVATTTTTTAAWTSDGNVREKWAVFFQLTSTQVSFATDRRTGRQAADKEEIGNSSSGS